MLNISYFSPQIGPKPILLRPPSPARLLSLLLPHRARLPSPAAHSGPTPPPPSPTVRRHRSGFPTKPSHRHLPPSLLRLTLLFAVPPHSTAIISHSGLVLPHSSPSPHPHCPTPLLHLPDESPAPFEAELIPSAAPPAREIKPLLSLLLSGLFNLVLLPCVSIYFIPFALGKRGGAPGFEGKL
jgi:hypothetical protein